MQVFPTFLILINFPEKIGANYRYKPHKFKNQNESLKLSTYRTFLLQVFPITLRKYLWNFFLIFIEKVSNQALKWKFDACKIIIKIYVTPVAFGFRGSFNKKDKKLS